MLLNVYIFHFAFWYEMIDSLCSSYSSSLAWKPWVYWVKSLSQSLGIAAFSDHQHWSIWSKILVTELLTCESFTKNEEYITNMSGKTTLFFIIDFDVFMWDSKKPQKMRLCIASQMGYKVKSFQLLGWFEIMGGGSRTYVPVEDVLFQANIFKSKRN